MITVLSSFIWKKAAGKQPLSMQSEERQAFFNQRLIEHYEANSDLLSLEVFKHRSEAFPSG
jgi:hypothetical protein